MTTTAEPQTTREREGYVGVDMGEGDVFHVHRRYAEALVSAFLDIKAGKREAGPAFECETIYGDAIAIDLELALVVADVSPEAIAAATRDQAILDAREKHARMLDGE